MTIRYRNTFGDILALSFYTYLRSPVVVGSFVLMLGILSVIIVGAIPERFTVVEKVVMFVVWEGIALLFFSALTALSVVLSLISRKNKTVLTEHTLILAEEYFVEETNFNRTEHKWHGVQKLVRTRRHIFIFLAQYLAHAVPRRAFANDAEWNAFYQFCEERSPVR